MTPKEMLDLQIEQLVSDNDRMKAEIATLLQEHTSMRARNERLEWENCRLEMEINRLYDILLVKSKGS